MTRAVVPTSGQGERAFQNSDISAGIGGIWWAVRYCTTFEGCWLELEQSRRPRA
jgi:hypothetical protein